MSARVFFSMIAVLLVTIGILSFNDRPAPAIAVPAPIPGIDINCCREKIDAGIYIVNLLRALGTNDVEIGRWKHGTNWQLNIQQAPGNTNRMVVRYTE